MSGLGEILKCALLNKDIYALIEKKHSFFSIVLACARFKERIVSDDFKDEGVRRILNLGHSLGHPLERIYSIPHGMAVYWGMMMLSNSTTVKRV